MIAKVITVSFLLNELAFTSSLKATPIKDVPQIYNSVHHLTSKKTSFKQLDIIDSNTYRIVYKTSFKDFKQTNDFKEINIIIAKQRYCRNLFYQEMKKGVVLDFYFYQRSSELLIANFSLDEKSCKIANRVFAEISEHLLVSKSNHHAKLFN